MPKAKNEPTDDGLGKIRRQPLGQIRVEDVFKVIRRVVDGEDEESTLDVAAFQSAI